MIAYLAETVHKSKDSDDIEKGPVHTCTLRAESSVNQFRKKLISQI